MPMEGSSEEYEKLTLASLKKAASPDSDATYHNNRAAIFSSLAMAAASAEMAEAIKHLAGLPSALAGGPAPAAPPRTATTASSPDGPRPAPTPIPEQGPGPGPASDHRDVGDPPEEAPVDPDARGLPSPSPVIELFKSESG